MIAISTTNYIAQALRWNSSHPSAAGYAPEDLQRDRIDIGWRPTPVTTTVTLEVDIGVGNPVDMVGILGAVAQTRMSQVVVRYSANWPMTSSTILTTITLDSRGDGAFVRPAHVSARAWRFEFLSSSPIHVGGLWLGRRHALSRAPTRIRVERLHPSIRNELETGHESVYQLAASRHTLTLEWGRLREAELKELVEVVDDLQGGQRPVLVVPEPSRTTATPYVIHGRLSDKANWQVDHPEYRGLGLELRESGRARIAW